MGEGGGVGGISRSEDEIFRKTRKQNVTRNHNCFDISITRGHLVHIQVLILITINAVRSIPPRIETPYDLIHGLVLCDPLFSTVLPN